MDYLTTLLEKTAAGESGAIENGDDEPDFLYVEDVARAIRLASEAPQTRSSGLTIVGDTRTMREAVAYVQQLLPDIELRVSPGGTHRGIRYDGSVTEEAIGYSPQFQMEDGFRKIINSIWYGHSVVCHPSNSVCRSSYFTSKDQAYGGVESDGENGGVAGHCQSLVDCLRDWQCLAGAGSAFGSHLSERAGQG